MTLIQFFNKRPAIAVGGIEVQLLAVAWFMVTHENHEEFTSTDIMNRLKEVGIPYREIPTVALRLSDLPGERLLSRSEGSTTFYRLSFNSRRLLDTTYADCVETPSAIVTASIIADLPKQYPSLKGCPYWDELSLCHGVKAYRATVIMAWNLIYNRLCDHIVTNDQRREAFNLAAQKTILKRDDFAEYREADVIAWARKAKVIDPNSCTILAERLKKRNIFAHASGKIPIPQDVDTFIEDLMRNVLPSLT
jgi:hypothetical protein